MLDGWAKVDQAEGLSGAHYLHTLSKPFHYITRQQAHKFKAIWVDGGERAAPLAINYLNLGIRHHHYCARAREADHSLAHNNVQI